MLFFDWGELEDGVAFARLFSVENRQVEFFIFCGEVIGGDSLGDQTAEICPFPTNKVVKLFESDKFMLICIGVAGI